MELQSPNNLVEGDEIVNVPLIKFIHPPQSKKEIFGPAVILILAICAIKSCTHNQSTLQYCAHMLA